MSCLCYLAPHKNRSTCLLPTPTPTPGCGPPLSLLFFFFAGCGLEVAKLFLEEIQRQSASSRERGVGEGVSRLKHSPMSPGTFSSCGEESSALPGIQGWQGWLAELRGKRAVQLRLVHPTLSLAILPHPGPGESVRETGGEGGRGGAQGGQVCLPEPGEEPWKYLSPGHGEKEQLPLTISLIHCCHS